MRSKKRFFLFNTLLFPVIIGIIFQIYYGTPNKLTIFEGEQYNRFLPPVLYSENYNYNASQNLKEGKYAIPLKLFGVFPIKTVEVSVTQKVSVIPMGNAIGIKMHSDGPIVVGFESFKTDKGLFDISKASNLKTGDRIIRVNNEICKNTKYILNKMPKKTSQSMIFGVIRNGRYLDVPVTPKYDVEAKVYRIGIWLRDSTAGIGTLTFVNPKNGKFAALGHGITDIDTNQIIDISDGKIVNANIFDIKKGEQGNPGELKGSISNQKALGNIQKNTILGVYGTIDPSINLQDIKPVETASRNQVKEGKAQILSCIDSNHIESFDIEITKCDPSNLWGAKGMSIRVTDKRLLERTGGIVQGMSGSPIIQNGKIAGAVTHVFISDPTKGYAIYIEDMLNELDSIS